MDSRGEEERPPQPLRVEEAGKDAPLEGERVVSPLPSELQQILDQEMQRRMMRRQKNYRQRPVEKDW